MKPLARPVSRRPAETIVALIDVMFFLLVFAMLIGRMDATAPFDVMPPIATQGDDLPGGGATIAISIEREFALDGVRLSRSDLLSEVADRISSQPDLRVRLNAHSELELRHVLPLIDDLSDAGAVDVVLVVERRE